MRRFTLLERGGMENEPRGMRGEDFVEQTSVVHSGKNRNGDAGQAVRDPILLQSIEAALGGVEQ